MIVILSILGHFMPSGYVYAEQSQSKTQESLNSGLFGKELADHNQEADISFRGDQGFKKADYYDLVGHVFIKQDNLTLTSNTARMYYSKSTSSKNSESKLAKSGIENAIAKGNVHISKDVSAAAPAFKASADEVELLVSSYTLVLRGSAKFWRADEFIHAEVISIDLKTNDIALKEPRGTFAAKKLPQDSSHIETSGTLP